MRFLGRFFRRMADRLDPPPKTPHEEKREHPVLRHGQAPKLEDVPQVAGVTHPHETGGGHHYWDTTPGRWGGPYIHADRSCWGGYV